MRKRETIVPNNHTERIQNSAQDNNVTKSLPEHIQKSAQGTNVPKNYKKTNKTVRKQVT